MKLEYKADLRVSEFGDLFVRQHLYRGAVNNHFARSGTAQSAQNLQQGGFAGTARTDNGDHLSFVNMQVDAFEHFEFAETFVNIFGVNHGVYVIFGAVLRLP